MRNYVRVVTPDDTQGAAAAVVAGDGGATRAVVLVQRAERPYSFPLARSFARRARASGLSVTTIGYDARPEFGALARRVAARRGSALAARACAPLLSGSPRSCFPAGQRFLKEFGQPPFDHRTFLGAPEAAQAVEVLLDAIAASDGTRASVVDRLFETNVSNGILGSFSFDRRGDIVPGAVGVYRVERGKEVVDGVVRLD